MQGGIDEIKKNNKIKGIIRFRGFEKVLVFIKIKELIIYFITASSCFKMTSLNAISQFSQPNLGVKTISSRKFDLSFVKLRKSAFG